MATSIKPKRKTRKPSETFPLFLRNDGRWSKKISGKAVYFGRDKAEALERYHHFMGNGRKRDGNEVGLRDLFNQYLAAQKRKRDAGKIGARAVSDSASTLRRVLAILGDRLVSALVSEDFGRLNVKLSRKRSPVTVGGDVRRTKAAFAWAVREGIIPRKPAYGSEFEPAPIRVVRLAKSQRAAVMFQPAELRKLLDSAPAVLRAMIYLGANAGLLPVDLARLELEEIDADFQWLRQARHKTGIDRLAALWPETATALKAAIALRPEPASPEFASRVFLTESGLPVVRTRTPAKAARDKKASLSATIINRATSDFRELQQDVGVYRHGRGFNALRHGFLTVAEAGRDFPAVAKVMGHSVPGVSSHYREHVGDDRIKAACWLVRDWLLAANQ